MATHARAGQPARPEDLVDVSHLVTAYFDLEPDPDDVSQQVAFGTSGHRGTSLTTSFNEVHIAATTQAICDYRREQGYDGPLFIGRDTHALSEPAWATALEVLAANDDPDLPWWRVVTAAGRLVPGNERRHAQLLRREGVAVRDGHVVGFSRARRARAPGRGRR